MYFLCEVLKIIKLVDYGILVVDWDVMVEWKLVEIKECYILLIMVLVYMYLYDLMIGKYG